jgi:hypothetical protein
MEYCCRKGYESPYILFSTWNNSSFFFCLEVIAGYTFTITLIMWEISTSLFQSWRLLDLHIYVSKPLKPTCLVLIDMLKMFRSYCRLYLFGCCKVSPRKPYFTHSAVKVSFLGNNGFLILLLLSTILFSAKKWVKNP